MLLRLLGAVLATALFLSPAQAAFDAGDIICETSTTTGTGTLNLAGAVTNYATFVSQITSGSSVNYHISASDGKLETGVGVLTDATPDTLTRVAYWSSDGSGSELTLPAGTHTVCLGPTVQMFAGMKGIQLYTDDAGAVGGVLPFWHDSATSANGDIAGEIQVWGGADDEEIGQIRMEVDDGATTTEDTRWEFVNRIAGADLTSFTLGYTEFESLYTHRLNVGSGEFAGLVVEGSSTGHGNGVAIYANSSTPAAGDQIAYLSAYGEDSAGNTQLYGAWQANIEDTTSGGEDASIDLMIVSGGSLVDILTVAPTAAFGDGSEVFISGNSILGLDDNTFLGFYETEANGDTAKFIVAPAAITSADTCTLENDANFIPDSCVGDGVDGSDARLKDVIGPAGDVGGIIDGIKIYDFKWNTDAPEASEQIRKGKRGFGPIAQELFNVNADFVEVGGDDPIKDPWTWKPERVVPYLIVEAQNLRKRVKALEDRLPTCYGIKLGSACLGVSM